VQTRNLRTVARNLLAPLVVVVAISGLGSTSVLGQSDENGESDDSDSRSAGVCSTDHDLDYVSYAEQYLEGDGEDRAPERAAEVLSNGCDRNDAAACERLADLFEEGTGVEADAERADELRDRAKTLRN